MVLLKEKRDSRLPSVKPSGCSTTSACNSSAFCQNGANAGSDSSWPLTLVRICTPLSPSFRTQRSSSSAASLPSGIGTLPRPAKRSGLPATYSAMPSLTICAARTAIWIGTV